MTGAKQARKTSGSAAGAAAAQSREALLRDVWGLDAAVETRTIDAHVKRLREKLGPAGSLIETVRGVGYRLSVHGAGDG